MDNHISKRTEPDALIWSEQQIALLRAGYTASQILGFDFFPAPNEKAADP